MTVSKKTLADLLFKYLNRQTSKEELIDWCEQMMQEESFENDTVQEIIARIGLMDAENFEVTYEDLSSMLNRLGYKLKVEIL